MLGQADLLERFQHTVAGRNIERQHSPGLALLLVIAGGLRLGTGLDRQQTNRWRKCFVVQQLGRAHRGAAGRRRQYALPVIGKENRIDQFGFTAREFGNECNRQFVISQARTRTGKPLIARRIRQLRDMHAGAIAFERSEHAAAPITVALKILDQIAHVIPPCFHCFFYLD